SLVKTSLPKATAARLANCERLNPSCKVTRARGARFQRARNVGVFFMSPSSTSSATSSPGGMKNTLKPLFVDADGYWNRLRDLVDGVLSDASDRCLAVLTAALAESHAPEATLVGLERFVRAVPNPRDQLDRLATSPRSVEVLLKVFAGSP